MLKNHKINPWILARTTQVPTTSIFLKSIRFNNYNLFQDLVLLM